MPDDQTQAFELALSAAQRAAAFCRRLQPEAAAKALDKSDGSPVTLADLGSQALICRELAREFPNDLVIAEEHSDTLRDEEHRPIRERLVEEVGRELEQPVEVEQLYAWIDHGATEQRPARFWTIDPIDGTKGFVRGNQYAIAIALIVNGQPEVAVLACPNLDVTDPVSNSVHGTLFCAARGQGATKVFGAGEREPIRVSSSVDRSDARFCSSFEAKHSSSSKYQRVADELGIKQEPLRVDSQAKYGLVAAGAAEAYVRFPPKTYREKIWDHAPGALIVTEAGGRVTDLWGETLDFGQGQTLPEGRGVVVTNCSDLHDAILGAFRTLLPA